MRIADSLLYTVHRGLLLQFVSFRYPFIAADCGCSEMLAQSDQPRFRPAFSRILQGSAELQAGSCIGVEIDLPGMQSSAVSSCSAHISCSATASKGDLFGLYGCNIRWPCDRAGVGLRNILHRSWPLYNQRDGTVLSL